MDALAVVVGVLLVASVLCDLVNTLVTTTTSQSSWWLTARLYRASWTVIRGIGRRFRSDARREALFSTFASVSTILLLATWVTQQIVGFGLIWWGLGGLAGGESLSDSIYYSGVVYFTLGFGEIVPTEIVPRTGALIEALAGVLTTAMVIGYLPALYGAYSERERKLMTLDDGGEDRISPTNLVIARSPNADVDELFEFFAGWEDWIAGVSETHTTFPMLVLFRSQSPGQNWVTALGLVADAALHCQLIRGAENRAPYWALRRSIRLFQQLTHGVDLSDYRRSLDESYASSQGAEGPDGFIELYQQLEAHGFDLVPLELGRARTMELRRHFDAALEYLIDALEAPRGFWGHSIGHALTPSARRPLDG